MNSATPPAQTKPKPGPKGRVLEPYAGDILLRARQGQSMQDIVNWLAQPPRCVAITRQAVHLWLKARIRKLEKLNATFAQTGIGAPFQGSIAPTSAPATPVASAVATTMLDSSRHAPLEPAPLTTDSSRSQRPAKERVDVSDLLVNENDWNRAENPLRDEQDP